MSHRGATAAIAVVSALLAPATAGAATFFVDGSAPSSSNPCTSQASRCKTINDAISQARGAGFPGGDLIKVAVGSYPESLALTDALDSGDTIEGGGTAAVGGTLLAPTSFSKGVVTMGFFNNSLPTNLTLKNLRIRVTQTPGAAASLNSPHTSLSNVVAENTNPSNPDPLVIINTQGTLDRVSALGQWNGGALLVRNGGSGTVRDSNFRLQSSSSTKDGIDVAEGTVTVQRTGVELSNPNGGAALRVGGKAASATVDSSLLLGGASGVVVSTGSAKPASATLRNATVDAGQPGPDAAPGLSATGTGATANLDVRSSISMEGIDAAQASGGTAVVTCSNSEVPPKTQPAGGAFGLIDCGATRANSQHPPEALFRDYVAADYRLRTLSPAVDSGAPGGLAAGESPTDLSGNKRVLDGNLDCIGRRDRGAYELTGRANTPPKPSISGAKQALAKRPVSFTGSAVDQDPLSVLKFRWTFPGPATVTGRKATRRFSTKGLKTIRLAVTDTHGCVGRASRNVQVKPPVVIRGVKVKPSSVPAGTQGTLSFKLTEPASVRVEITLSGNPEATLKRKHAKAGKNSFKLPAELAAGTHGLRITAKDALGGKSVRNKSFTVIP